jgi:hypothetical protein
MDTQIFKLVIMGDVSVFLVEGGMRNVDSDSKIDGGIEMM